MSDVLQLNLDVSLTIIAIMEHKHRIGSCEDRKWPLYGAIRRYVVANLNRESLFWSNVNTNCIKVALKEVWNLAI